MQVRFWGVRGSVAVSGPEFHRTGGNTSCIELRHGGARLVLDGGTGLRALGASIGFAPVDLTLVFSHFHWDHIQGFPFFAPAFHPDSRLTLVGAARDSGDILDALRAQMQPPRFPVTMDAVRATIEVRTLSPGEVLRLGPFSLRGAELSHPDGMLGVRVSAGGRSVVYATDHEHGVAEGARRDGGLDRRLLSLAEGADLLVHDAQYTDAEYRGAGGPPRRGWGHSTWTEATAAAHAAGVERLALFHHDPARTDDQLAVIESAARQQHRGTMAAREGLQLAL